LAYKIRLLIRRCGFDESLLRPRPTSRIETLGAVVAHRKRKLDPREQDVIRRRSPNPGKLVPNFRLAHQPLEFPRCGRSSRANWLKLRHVVIRAIRDWSSGCDVKILVTNRSSVDWQISQPHSDRDCDRRKRPSDRPVPLKIGCTSSGFCKRQTVETSSRESKPRSRPPSTHNKTVRRSQLLNRKRVPLPRDDGGGRGSAVCLLSHCRAVLIRYNDRYLAIVAFDGRWSTPHDT